MIRKVLLPAIAALSLGKSGLAVSASSHVRALPKILPKGPTDFSLEGTLHFPKSHLETRDGSFDTVGISTSWVIGGQKQVGFIDLGAGDLSTRNISDAQTDSPQNGWYEVSSTATVLTGSHWQECFDDGCFGGQVIFDYMTVGNIDQLEVMFMACDDTCRGSSANWGMTRGLSSGSFSYNGGDISGPSFMGTLVANKTLSQNLWTMGFNNSDGIFNFGYIDDSLYTGFIGFLDNDNSNAFWNSAVTGYSFSNGGPSSTTDVLRFWLDTGNPYTGLPSDLFAAVHAVVPGAVYDSSGHYHYPCNEQLPSWTMNIGGIEITISGDNFVGGVVSGNTCWSTFVSGSSFESGVGNAWGLDFLRGVFMVFDYSSDDQSDRIGFAQQPA